MPEKNIPMPQSQHTSGWAIAGFICAFLIPILGLIFSIVALVKINKNNSLKGKGLAIAGIVISVIWFPIQLILISMSTLFLIGTNDVGTTLPNRCTMSPPFSCSDLKVEDNGNLDVASFSLGGEGISSNEATNKIESVTINGVPCTGLSNDGRLVDINDQTKDIRYYKVKYSCNGNFGDAGDRFRGDITINYESESTGLKRDITSSISGSIQ